MMPSSIGAGGTVDVDLSEVGIVVLDSDGRVTSTNARARELLRAESLSALSDRIRDLQGALVSSARQNGPMEETPVDMADLGLLSVRSSDVAGVASDGRVLLLRDGRSLPGTASLLQQAARHRTFSFLSRDWAHDLKGMLHVIRINSALLARLLQRQPVTVDAPVTKCLEAIPREIERLDRAIELMFHGRPAEQPTAFDIGAMCERLKNLIAARAVRHRVEVVVDVKRVPMEIVGFEDQVQGAVLNVIVNALEAMPEQGRLVISADSNATHVCVRICDSGAGIQPQPAERLWRPHFVNDPRQTGIGLHVTRAIVESHGGRIECASNVPRGTCIELTFPTAASTGRLAHGSRTHR
jgi:signal transduction histidine kinase